MVTFGRKKKQILCMAMQNYNFLCMQVLVDVIPSMKWCTTKSCGWITTEKCV